MQNSRVKLITPLLMLFAGALASIIMYVKKYEFYRMLWVLLIVLIVFYIIGDVVRYLYTMIQPRVIPADSIDDIMQSLENSIIEKEADETIEEEEVLEAVDEDGTETEDEETMEEEDDIEDESLEEYTEENLDEM